jgi:hypothetical protein
MFDVARMSANGRLVDGTPYAFAYVSAFTGALARVRLSLGDFLPYADLAFGAVVVDVTRCERTECSIGSGPNLAAGAGLKYALAANVLLGARASARLPGYGVSCDDVNGSWQISGDPLLAFGATFDFRW